MFPSPFPRLDSIPPALPPPSGNAAAINSLNASADAGAGRAKTPFPGPSLSWVSTVLGRAQEPLAGAGASDVVGRAVKCLGRSGHVKASGLYLWQMTAAPWLSPAFNFQDALSKSQHTTQLAGSSPGFSSIWFPSLHPLLSSSLLSTLFVLTSLWTLDLVPRVLGVCSR